MRALICVAAIAACSLTSGGAVAQTVPQTVEVPGVTHTVEAGDIITEKDIGPVEAPRYAAHLAPVLADLIGKEAKHRLEGGKPIHSYDVGPPQLVKKGMKVSLVVQKGLLTITAEGKALNSGAAGETVRVQNTASFALLDGEVTGEGLVLIEPSSR